MPGLTLKKASAIIVVLLTLWLVYGQLHKHLKLSQGRWNSHLGGTTSLTDGVKNGTSSTTPGSHSRRSAAYQAKTKGVKDVKGNATYSRLLFGPASRSTVLENTLSIHLVVVPFMQYNTTDRATLLAREKEYKTALQRNLIHPLVSYVHVLTTNTQQTLQHFGELSNHSKMVISKVKSVDLMRDPFDYISQNLVGEDVMFSNADIYLGNGFDAVDPIQMRQQNITYALTRRVPKEQKCDHPLHSIGGIDMCLDRRYWGSHDTFLFQLTEPLPEEALKELEFNLGSPGQENVLIWLFREKLKYCVLNPCRILETFHLHCSDLRNRETKTRVNTGGKSGMAPFTNKVVCL